MYVPYAVEKVSNHLWCGDVALIDMYFESHDADPCKNTWCHLQP